MRTPLWRSSSNHGQAPRREHCASPACSSSCPSVSPVQPSSTPDNSWVSTFSFGAQPFSSTFLPLHRPFGVKETGITREKLARHCISSCRCISQFRPQNNNEIWPSWDKDALHFMWRLSASGPFQYHSAFSGAKGTLYSPSVRLNREELTEWKRMYVHDVFIMLHLPLQESSCGVPSCNLVDGCHQKADNPLVRIPRDYSEQERRAAPCSAVH